MIKKPELKVKLSLEKETVRVLDDSQLHLLDEVIGGVALPADSCNTTRCFTSCGSGSCTAGPVKDLPSSPSLPSL
jgi:hypothetical protein